MDVESAAVLANADTLGGYPASDYAFVEDLKNLKPEDIGAAPAGYGLGTNAKKVLSRNDINCSGFWIIPSEGDVPDKNYSIWGYASSLDANTIIFIATNVFGNVVQCVKKSGSWGEWEWINPPLELGISYRTTERYKGLPVYIKASELDLSPAGSKYVGIQYGLTNIVSIEGSIFNRSDSSYVLLSTYADNIVVNVSGNLFFSVTDNSVAHPIVKYTM
jgi:hypothetical protein